MHIHIYDEQANNKIELGLKNNDSFNALSTMINTKRRQKKKKDHDYINRFVYESKFLKRR